MRIVTLLIICLFQFLDSSLWASSNAFETVAYTVNPENVISAKSEWIRLIQMLETNSISWMSFASIGASIQVPESDADKARRIIQKAIGEKTIDAKKLNLRVVVKKEEK